MSRSYVLASSSLLLLLFLFLLLTFNGQNTVGNVNRDVLLVHARQLCRDFEASSRPSRLRQQRGSPAKLSPPRANGAISKNERGDGARMNPSPKFLEQAVDLAAQTFKWMPAKWGGGGTRSSRFHRDFGSFSHDILLHVLLCSELWICHSHAAPGVGCTAVL